MTTKNPDKLPPKGGMCMMIGTVLGAVSLSRGVNGAVGQRFVQVRCGYALVTALDTVGVEQGETVLVTTGEGAGSLCPDFPVDTVILGAAGNNG